jgi:anti-sigma regulatory factor (Ser/Thr protein kinase)
MPESSARMPEEHIVLCGSLDELAQVWPWVEELSAEYAISEDVRFAIDLCLEEALSNIVRHGYKKDCARPITVSCSVDEHPSARRELVFVIEDKAPHFNPLDKDLDQAEIAHTLDDLMPGGQGIRLLHKFAGSLRYEPLAEGNRLMIGFPIPSAGRG